VETVGFEDVTYIIDGNGVVTLGAMPPEIYDIYVIGSSGVCEYIISNNTVAGGTEQEFGCTDEAANNTAVPPAAFDDNSCTYTTLCFSCNNGTVGVTGSDDNPAPEVCGAAGMTDGYTQAEADSLVTNNIWEGTSYGDNCVPGCMDIAFNVPGGNYNANATWQPASGPYSSCDISGCMDDGSLLTSNGDPYDSPHTGIEACNYDPTATLDDGSCNYVCIGCTVLGADNYNPAHTVDDGSCVFTDPATDPDVEAFLTVDSTASVGKYAFFSNTDAEVWDFINAGGYAGNTTSPYFGNSNAGDGIPGNPLQALTFTLRRNSVDTEYTNFAFFDPAHGAFTNSFCSFTPAQMYDFEVGDIIIIPNPGGYEAIISGGSS